MGQYDLLEWMETQIVWFTCTEISTMRDENSTAIYYMLYKLQKSGLIMSKDVLRGKRTLKGYRAKNTVLKQVMYV